VKGEIAQFTPCGVKEYGTGVPRAHENDEE